MGLLGILLLILFILASLLLITLVLIQDEQGEGLGGIFGGGSTTPFGSRSGNVLSKFTAILGAVFLFCAFGLAWINKTPESGDVLGAARRGAGSEISVEEWWTVSDNGDGVLEAGATEETQAEDGNSAGSDEE
jgi:preprotein translocase subunit SecG